MHPIIATLLAAAIAPGLTVGSPSLINETCTATSNYGYCLGVLSADPAGASATDKRGLAIAAANITMRNVTSTVRVLTELVEELKLCIKYYQDMDDLVASAIDDLRVGRPAVTSFYKLHRASDEPGNCDIMLFEGKRPQEPGELGEHVQRGHFKVNQRHRVPVGTLIQLA
uniref:Pectinesterase inhibitor domain-containing protein n=1 Tax=Oryza nivara TaxID=4536 RepID=A0A0E0G5Y3_ORYNI